MTAVTLGKARRAQRAPQRAKRYPERPTWRTVVVTAAAYVTGFLFIFPYLDMIITSVRPQGE